LSRVYESFKTEAKRLTSVSCDKCGAELWKAPGQPWVRWVGSMGIHPAARDLARDLDLCPNCAEELSDLIIHWLGREVRRED
jgi:hypothetical protein